jgi:uncharacterized protein YdaU (DUF1376 family)
VARFDGLTIWTEPLIADTTHLSKGEFGAYLLLLIAAWRNPDCDLPDDDRRLARFARCTDREWATNMRALMLTFFRCENGRWTQKRLTEERAKTLTRAKKARSAAHIRHNTKEDVQKDKPLETPERGDANASSEHVLNGCSHDALGLGLGLEKKERVPKPSVSPSTSVEGSFAEWWKNYPRKVAKADAIRAYKAAIKRGATPDPSFIPYPATWLNQARWEDEEIAAPIADAYAPRERLGW